MHALGIGRTDVGRERERNEDRLLVDNELGLFAVADGMGGHAAGDVAAQTAVDAIAQAIQGNRSTLERIRNGQEAPAVLTAIAENAVQQANSEVFRLTSKRTTGQTMGCTFTVLLVAGAKAALAHVGDSRLYLCREGSVHQLSTDHTLVAELTRSGALSAEEAKEHPYGHMLTRAIGIQERVRVDTLLLDLAPGDRFLLCSDGLHYYIKDPQSLGQQIDSDDFDGIPQQLISFANHAGGGDNITALVVRVEADPPERSIVVSLSTQVNIKLEALSSVFLFEGLSLAQLARVLNVCDVTRHEPGSALVEEGDRISKMIVVANGLLSVAHGDKVLTALGLGDHSGATSLLRPRAARATLRAQEEAQVLTLEGKAFKDLVSSQPWLGVALMERLALLLSEELDEAFETIDSCGQLGARGDMKDFL